MNRNDSYNRPRGYQPRYPNFREFNRFPSSSYERPYFSSELDFAEDNMNGSYSEQERYNNMFYNRYNYYSFQQPSRQFQNNGAHYPDSFNSKKRKRSALASGKKEKKPSPPKNSRPSSPFCGTEEHTNRKIQLFSEEIKKQLAMTDDEFKKVASAKTTESPEVPEDSAKQTTDTLTSQPVEKEKCDDKLKPTSKNSKSKHAYDIEEIHGKIVQHILKLNSGKRINLINSDISEYDVAINRIYKQKRLELSKALRDMCSSTEVPTASEVVNSIIPDFGIKLEELPLNVIKELSSTLNLDNDFFVVQDIPNSENDNASTSFEEALSISSEIKIEDDIEPCYLEDTLSNPTDNEPRNEIEEPKIGKIRVLTSELFENPDAFKSNSKDLNSQNNFSDKFISSCQNFTALNQDKNKKKPAKTSVNKEVLITVPVSTLNNNELTDGSIKIVNEPNLTEPVKNKDDEFITVNIIKIGKIAKIDTPASTSTLVPTEETNGIKKGRKRRVGHRAGRKRSIKAERKAAYAAAAAALVNPSIASSISPSISLTMPPLLPLTVPPLAPLTISPAIPTSNLRHTYAQTDPVNEPCFSNLKKPKTLQEALSHMFNIDKEIERLTNIRQNMFKNLPLLPNAVPTNSQNASPDEECISLIDEEDEPEAKRAKKDCDSPTEAPQTSKECLVPKSGPVEKLAKSESVNGFVAKIQAKVLAIKIIGKTIILGTESGNLYFLSSKTGQKLTTVKVSNLPIISLEVLRNTLESTWSILVATMDKNFKIYKFENKRLAASLPLKDTIQCMEVAWNSVFMGGKSGSLTRYSIKTKKIVFSETLFNDKYSILVLKATQEGARDVLLVGMKGRPVTVCDAWDGLILRTISDLIIPTGVYSLVLEKSLLYCGTTNHDIVVYKFHNGEYVTTFNTFNGKGIGCMKILNNLLFAGCHDGNIYIYNIKDKKFITHIEGPGGSILSMEILGNQILIGTITLKFTGIMIPNSALKFQVTS